MQKVGCSDSLSKKNEKIAKTIEFNGEEELADWKIFFKNNDEVVCPITSCKIMKPGCKEEKSEKETNL